MKDEGDVRKTGAVGTVGKVQLLGTGTMSPFTSESSTS